MKHNYLNNTNLNEAREKYLKTLKDSGFKFRTHTIPSCKALGSVTAAAVYAKICSPHYNASAMDLRKQSLFSYKGYVHRSRHRRPDSR